MTMVSFQEQLRATYENAMYIRYMLQHEFPSDLVNQQKDVVVGSMTTLQLYKEFRTVTLAQALRMINAVPPPAIAKMFADLWATKRKEHDDDVRT